MKLTRFERRWLLEMFDAILPSRSHATLTLGAADFPMDRFLDDAEAEAPFEYLLGLRVALWVVMLSPVILFYRARPWTWLPREERIEALRRLLHHPVYVLRELPAILKTVACLGYCGVPAVQAQIGFDRVDATDPAWLRRAP